MKITPIKAIRLKCLDCSENSTTIRECDYDCTLKPYRMGHKSKEAKISALKSIRLECISCVDGQTSLIGDCPSKKCPLFIYRSGHNPARKGLGGNLANLSKKGISDNSVCE